MSTSNQKANALSVFSDEIIIKKHRYEKTDFSGASNCWCGRHEKSSIHFKMEGNKILKTKQWHIQENITAFAVKQKSENRTRQDSQICSVSKIGHMRHEAEANARLIAAAPELLQIAEWTYNFLQGQLKNADIQDQIEKCAIILYKAKGEL